MALAILCLLLVITEFFQLKSERRRMSRDHNNKLFDEHLLNVLVFRYRPYLSSLNPRCTMIIHLTVMAWIDGMDLISSRLERIEQFN